MLSQISIERVKLLASGRSALAHPRSTGGRASGSAQVTPRENRTRHIFD